MSFEDKPRIVVGFDFGTRRIGVAVGETHALTARPIATVPAKDGTPDWPKIKAIIKKWRPDALIVGIPLNMNGTPQPITARAEHFAASLREQFKIPVYNCDERLTTKDAREQLFAKEGFRALQDGQVDRVAAQLIIQTWFEEQLKK